MTISKVRKNTSLKKIYFAPIIWVKEGKDYLLRFHDGLLSQQLTSTANLVWHNESVCASYIANGSKDHRTISKVLSLLLLLYY